MDVLIIGGYGAMAQSTVPDLLSSPGVARVGIGGRNDAKAKAFAAAQRDDRAVPVSVDARDAASLVRELKKWDSVINSSWYDLNVPIMEAAIEAGIHYCDLGGLYHQTIRQLKLDSKAKDAGVKCVQEMDFIVAFPPAFRQTVETLVRLGLAHRDEIVVEGAKVRPYDATSTVIDNLPKPKEPELDVDIQRCVLIGEKDGNAVTLRYEAVTWPHKKWNVGGGVVDTGVPPSIAAQWMVKGQAGGPGVVPPELAFEPMAYFRELSARGRGIRVVEIAEETRTLN